MIKKELGTISALAKRINELDQEEGLVKAIDTIVPGLESQLQAKDNIKSSDDFER